MPVLAGLLACSAPPEPGWHVYAVEYGRSDRFSRAAMVLGAPEGDRVPASWMVWVVRDGSHVVLVDTGFRDPALAERWGIRQLRTASEALGDLGLSASAVTDVVVTHPHWDHLGGLADVPGARVWIQKDALTWARSRVDPEHPERSGVRLADLEGLERADLRVVDGDSPVAPGLILHGGGGHTPGSQWVEVDGAVGTIALAGDIAYLFENVETGTPPGGSVDPERDRAAIVLMNGLAPGRVIPGHDPAVFERFHRVTDRSVEIR